MPNGWKKKAKGISRKKRYGSNSAGKGKGGGGACRLSSPCCGEVCIRRHFHQAPNAFSAPRKLKGTHKHRDRALKEHIIGVKVALKLHKRT